MATNLPPPLNFPNFRARKMHLTAYFPHYHNTKLLGKSFARRKTTYEIQPVSRCISIGIKNICFAALTKSFATPLFGHITKEHREIGITFRKPALVSDVDTLHGCNSDGQRLRLQALRNNDYHIMEAFEAGQLASFV